MPDVNVFITGSTGFIGSKVANAALAAGYRVRLSIRKHEQAQKILKYYPEYASKIDTVVIPDMTKPASFESALNGIDYIVHLASPMPGTGSDVRSDYVDPAVQSTEAILYAAMEFPTIKTIIIVSSALALAPIDAVLATEGTVKGRALLVFPTRPHIVS